MRKRTRIVPSLVMTATFVSVLPSCGGTTASDDGGSDGSNDIVWKGVADVGFGVAAVAYCCFDSGVADAAFADAPPDAPDEGG